MRLPRPCDEDPGLLAPPILAEAADLEDEDLSPVHHYDRAIKALAGDVYGGLASSERRKLLASLCREKQRLHERHLHDEQEEASQNGRLRQSGGGS
jgi:hypothetical protein